MYVHEKALQRGRKRMDWDRLSIRGGPENGIIKTQVIGTTSVTIPPRGSPTLGGGVLGSTINPEGSPWMRNSCALDASPVLEESGSYHLLSKLYSFSHSESLCGGTSSRNSARCYGASSHPKAVQGGSSQA